MAFCYETIMKWSQQHMMTASDWVFVVNVIPFPSEKKLEMQDNAFMRSNET